MNPEWIDKTRKLAVDTRRIRFDWSDLARFHSFLLFLIVLGALNNPFGLPLNLRVLPAFAGLAFVLVYGKIHTYFIPLYCLIVLGVISGVSNHVGPETYFRLLQVFCLIGVALFISRERPESLSVYIGALLPTLGIAVLIIDIFVVGPAASRFIFGAWVPRYSGITGHHNYSAVLCAFLSIVLVIHRRRFLAGLFLVLTVFAASRGFLLALLVSGFFYSIRGTRILRLAILTAVLGIFLFPFFLLVLDGALTEEQKIAVSVITSLRYVHWLSYLQMGMENPILGVGYFNGLNVYADYHVDIFPSLLREQEAHSLSLAIWGEFGVVGWLLVTVFFLNLANVISKEIPQFAPILIFVLVAYSFYNALTEWPLWIGIGYLMSLLNEERRMNRC